MAVFMFGVIKKGARRWLHIGVDIQPSEIMKIAMPLMLAWYFQQRSGMLRWHSFLLAAVLLIIPVGLIAKQPDLGTALLVLASGFYVIFLAGLSWKALVGLVVAAGASLPVAWSLMHDYQRERVMTLIDPTSDPLGKGFHIIQSTIAIGSGGVMGKGYHKGTQAYLEFIPERTTDFIFSVYSEEYGLLGNLFLLFLYLLLIGRGLMIAANAPTLFTRLLAGAITMIFFTYAFVNMGMVSGILPVVGVPLALHELRRHRPVYPGAGCGHPDEHSAQPQAGADVSRRAALAVVAVGIASLLAGCASETLQKMSPFPATKTPAAKHTPLDPRLPAAGSGRGGYYLDDGPGDDIPPGLADLPDPIVRNEPLSKYGNRPYVVFGKTYTPISPDAGFVQRGVASWYGKKFHGQRTSSGELYDMYQLSAAHPTLPIPSYRAGDQPGDGQVGGGAGQRPRALSRQPHHRRLVHRRPETGLTGEGQPRGGSGAPAAGRPGAHRHRAPQCAAAPDARCWWPLRPRLPQRPPLSPRRPALRW